MLSLHLHYTHASQSVADLLYRPPPEGCLHAPAPYPFHTFNHLSRKPTFLGAQ